MLTRTIFEQIHHGSVKTAHLPSALDLPEPPEWVVDALCAQTDPDAFFPEKGGDPGPAKQVCLGCSVRAECLQYALDNGERFGVWGGLSERARRRLQRRAV